MGKNSNNDRIFVIGIKTKLLSFLFRYPWRAMFLLSVSSSLLLFIISGEITILIRTAAFFIIGLSVLTALMQYLTKNHCYKVVVDHNRKRIIFFYMYNRGVIEEDLKTIKVRIDHHCKIISSTKAFIIFPETIRELVSVLPKCTTVEYVGFFGHFKEKDWKNRNIELKPGSGL